MKIAVCIKQVPSSENVKVDTEKGILIRDNLESKMNPLDLNALEAGINIKENLGGELSVITMGPPQAKDIIKEAYGMGADKGYLLSDRKFAGADVLATSHTLAEGIKKMGEIDLILCGKLTVDGDTAQVGPTLATMLKIPHVIAVKKIIEATDKKVVVEREKDNGTEIVEIALPCLLTIDKEASLPRLPSYLKMKASRDREIEVFTMNELEDKNEENYGLEGSPTKVNKIFNSVTEKEKELWTGVGEELGDKFSNKLKELKFI
ncbi:MAG: electron transfer flavoprotein subunit beta/FixA family protein [Clostridium sp.]|uniref:electron transfer flavoprotein subunit beta/FixA family protein n=1 Tax=Clostridium sp. TaxID=1506 RepID=UPI003EE56E76